MLKIVHTLTWYLVMWGLYRLGSSLQPLQGQCDAGPSNLQFTFTLGLPQQWPRKEEKVSFYCLESRGPCSRWFNASYPRIYTRGGIYNSDKRQTMKSNASAMLPQNASRSSIPMQLSTARSKPPT
ncbi:hypothetical protein B0T14DRAFT_196888 [Immersiella caudata]|uniref:Secreted protein n=1 Tax=Immersiella caudata TaxID=314043 RepID=A0AA39WNW3_9PEZI|nr:hypothetical protein B0T14DRAFT_196888 [Immersiella caudata]